MGADSTRRLVWQVSPMSDLIDLVTRSLSEEAAEEFMARVETQVDQLAEEFATGSFENEDYSVGLEMEVYAIAFDVATDSQSEGVEEDTLRLDRLPASVFESGAAKELGLHNAELNTTPDPFTAAGLASQSEGIAADFETADAAARENGCRLVLDSMWTTPPAEGSDQYLSDVEKRDGITLATNMREDPRYAALDNHALEFADGEIPFDVPGVERTFPSILFESLATSIQPHLQIPNSEAFPAYYNTGIRTLGPILALSTNSPFLPPDLYTDRTDPESLVERTHHELRIAVFEQSVNQTPNPKVRVPDDIDDVTDVLADILADDLIAPFLREWTTDDERNSLAEEFWEFRYKRSSYWRWLRCVVGGEAVADASDDRSLRIEYRPIPTQPTIRDVVGMQVLTSGLLHGLVAADHPLADLEWSAAETSFYNAAEDGLDAALAWVTADGARTEDPAVIFSEVFRFAREGLADIGLETAAIETYLAPIEARWEARTTPSVWKKERVRQALANGQSFDEAVREMQAVYLELSQTTDSFAEWL